MWAHFNWFPKFLSPKASFNQLYLRTAAAPYLTKSCWAWWGPWGRTQQKTSSSTWSSRSTSTETAPSSFQSSLNWWSRRQPRCGSLDSNLISSNQYFSSFSFFSRNNLGLGVLGTHPLAFVAGRRCRHNKGSFQDFRPGQRWFHQHKGAEKGDHCLAFKVVHKWLHAPIHLSTKHEGVRGWGRSFREDPLELYNPNWTNLQLD